MYGFLEIKNASISLKHTERFGVSNKEYIENTAVYRYKKKQEAVNLIEYPKEHI